MKKIKRLAIILAALVLALSFTACGSGSAKGDSYSTGSYSPVAATEEAYYDYGYSDEWNYEESTVSNTVEDDYSEKNDSAEQFDDSARKLIKTYNLTVETEEFDGFMDMIQSKVSQLGGYIENLNTYNGSYYYSYGSTRHSNLTVRIPVSKADEFLEMIGEKGNVTNKSLSVEDVTLSYVDLSSRKATYEAEEKRILELLDKAETIEDILVIEDKLANIRYQLESMESQLRTYDNLVDYTTIYLNLEEVKEYTEPEPETYGQQVAESFKNGLQRVGRGFKNFSINLVGALPGLVVFAVICVAIVFIIRAIVKSSKKKKAAKLAAQYAAAVQNMQNGQNDQIMGRVLPNSENNTQENK